MYTHGEVVPGYGKIKGTYLLWTGIFFMFVIYSIACMYIGKSDLIRVS